YKRPSCISWCRYGCKLNPLIVSRVFADKSSVCKKLRFADSHVGISTISSSTLPPRTPRVIIAIPRKNHFCHANVELNLTISSARRLRSKRNHIKRSFDSTILECLCRGNAVAIVVQRRIRGRGNKRVKVGVFRNAGAYKLPCAHWGIFSL